MESGALIGFLESIENILHRLHIYTRISTTPAMGEIVAKIMVELLSLLALATKKLKQGRSSESFLALFCLCLAQRSQICKEGLGRDGYRDSPAEKSRTYAR